MSILYEILKEENNRIEAIINSYSKELLVLPVGYIAWKKINKKKYPYLQYRNGDTIKSKYIRENEILDIEQKITRRKKIKKGLRELKTQKNILEKTLKKEF